MLTFHYIIPAVCFALGPDDGLLNPNLVAKDYEKGKGKGAPLYRH